MFTVEGVLKLTDAEGRQTELDLTGFKILEQQVDLEIDEDTIPTPLYKTGFHTGGVKLILTMAKAADPKTREENLRAAMERAG